MLRVSRSRGAFSGMLLLLLGAWGGLIPFVGPYFSYAYTPNSPWTYTTGRLWLEIVPGAAVFLGALILMAARLRPVAQFGAVLAVLGGIWFVVGGTLSTMWASTYSYSAGVPAGGTVLRAVEQIGFFSGLGVIIVLFAAMALGRLSIVAVRDARLAEASESFDEQPAPVRVGAEPDGDDAETGNVPYPRRSPSVPPG
jgi:hypothetical protein